MVDLTNRQITILKFLIEEYIETAEPVSSDTLDKKYDLGVSPATIRNEMVVLSENGFIKKTSCFRWSNSHFDGIEVLCAKFNRARESIGGR